VEDEDACGTQTRDHVGTLAIELQLRVIDNHLGNMGTYQDQTIVGCIVNVSES
jgi:hypothetical protein